MYLDVVESTPSYTDDIEDEDIEEEFKKLELEVGSGNLQVPGSKVGVDSAAGQAEASECAESLSAAMSNLKLTDNSTRESAIKNSMVAMRKNTSTNAEPEAA